MAAALIFAACGAEDQTNPVGRVVSLETTACGHASRTTGAGVIVEDGWVLTAAHVVVGATEVEVAGVFGTETAETVVLDTTADLALLRVAGAEASPIELDGASAGDAVQWHIEPEAEPSTLSVLRPVEIRIGGVRSTERISRFGFEFDRRVELGDSGGGVFNADGRLVGVIFGRSTERENRSFAVNHDMIGDVLVADRSGAWSCDPTVHRVVEVS